MHNERRGAQRLSMEPLGLFVLACEQGAQIICALENLSILGMGVELVSCPPEGMFRPGDTVRIAHCPDSLADFLAGLEGEVCWLRGERAGICFTGGLPLSNGALAAYLESQSLLAWDDWTDE
jgi:hypothetical protein